MKAESRDDGLVRDWERAWWGVSEKCTPAELERRKQYRLMAKKAVEEEREGLANSKLARYRADDEAAKVRARERRPDDEVRILHYPAGDFLVWRDLELIARYIEGIEIYKHGEGPAVGVGPNPDPRFPFSWVVVARPATRSLIRITMTSGAQHYCSAERHEAEALLAKLRAKWKGSS